MMNDETLVIPEMVTIKTASQRTGLSYDFVRKLCLEKRIVFIKSGSMYLINFPKFCEYLNGGCLNEIDQ